MTGDEMERAIEFLLRSQATFEQRQEAANRRLEETAGQLEKTGHQIEETSRQVRQLGIQAEALAESQTQLVGIVTDHLQEEGEFRREQREFSDRVSKAIADLAISQTRADERINSLSSAVERFINGAGTA